MYVEHISQRRQKVHHPLLQQQRMSQITTRMKTEIVQVDSADCLKGFECGVKYMDEFVNEQLSICIGGGTIVSCTS